MGDQFKDTSALRSREVELHVCRIFLELLQQVILRRATDVMNLVDLIELIVSREEGEK